jgi:phage-related protein
MLNETFYLDGVDARSVGIHLQAPLTFSEAVPISEAQSIPGRNGDLIFETGSYENRSGSASCFCLQRDVEKALRNASRFLMSKKGYRRLETSDDPDHFWMARVENSPRIEQRLRTLAPFDIGFDCKPQRFLKSGETVIKLTESTSIFNITGYDALPLILLIGHGEGVLTVGDCTININEASSLMYLDSETMNAYNRGASLNDRINAPEFPVLVPGENQISFSGGIDWVEITPRWWEI